MPTPTTSRWPKPTSEDEFEDIVLDFLKLRWDTPHVTRNGRRGQGQNGVDCFARVVRLDGRLGVAQCKNMSRLSLGTVIDEVTAATGFDADTAEFLMVTSAERDETLQRAVREHFRANPVPFTVDVVFWPDIVLELAGHPAIVRKHWSGFFQEHAGPAAAAVSASSRVHPGMLRLIEDYSTLFGGRDDELTALDAFIDAPRTCLLMRAPAGRGKTALLVHWVKMLRNATSRNARQQDAMQPNPPQRNATHQGATLRNATQQDGGSSWDAVFHSISRRYQTATEHAVLYALASELAAAHRLSLSEFDSSPAQLKYVVADLLRREPPPDRHVVVVIDGIDECVGWEFRRDLLPGQLPPRTRLVLAARDMADRSEDAWLDLLGWQRADTVHFMLPPLSHDSIASVVDSLPATPEEVAPASLVDALERATEGDPLTMRFLIEALQQGELTVAELDRMPAGLASFIELWMRDIEQDVTINDFAYALLGLLATAMAPLPIEVIETLAPDVFDRRMKVQQAVRAVARFIVGDGTARSGYVLSHPRLREIFLDRLSPAERASFRARFVSTGETFWRQRDTSLPEYLRQFWVKHLEEANQWPLIEQVTTEIEDDKQWWWQMRFRSEGSHRGYLEDLGILMRHAEATTDLALTFRCALIVSTLRTVSANIPVDLLVDLVEAGTPEGRWTTTAAFECVRLMIDSRAQADAIEALVRLPVSFSVELALDVAEDIRELDQRVRALAALATAVPALAPKILQAADRINHAHFRARLLRSLSAVASHDEILARLPKCLTQLAAYPDKGTKVAGYADVARILGPDAGRAVWRRTLEIVSARRGLASNFNMLVSIASDLPSEFISNYLDAANRTTTAGRRANALVALGRGLPSSDLPALWESFIGELADVSAGNVPSFMDDVLSFLVHRDVPPSLESGRIREIVRGMKDAGVRARFAAALGAVMRAESDDALWTIALDAVRAIRGGQGPQAAWDTSAEAWTWRCILEFLPAQIRDTVWTEALASTVKMHYITTISRDDDPFCKLLKQLPLAHISAAAAIALDSGSARRLVHVARRLPSRERKESLATALKLAENIEDDKALGEFLYRSVSCADPTTVCEVEFAAAGMPLTSRLRVLTGVARDSEHGHALWPQCLQLVKSIADDLSRALAATSVIEHVPNELLPSFIDIGRAMKENEARARTLRAVALRVPTEDAAALWAEVLGAGFHTGSYIGEAMSHVTANLSPEDGEAQWLKVLESVISMPQELTRARALGEIASFVTPELCGRVLDVSTTLHANKFVFYEILKGLIGRSPGTLLERIKQVVDRYMKAGWKAALYARLSGRTPPDTAQELWETSLSILLPADSVSTQIAVSEWVGVIAVDKLRDLLPVATGIPIAHYRALALASVGTRLPSACWPALVTSGVGSTPDWRKPQLLSDMSALLTSRYNSHKDFQRASPTLAIESMLTLAQRRRAEFLESTGALMPWFAAMAPSAVDSMIRSSLAVCRCWP